MKLACDPHDWIVSIRVGDGPVMIFSLTRATEPQARASALAAALERAGGQEVHIGMRAVDTDPIVI
jgi:hypothetical protein